MPNCHQITGLVSFDDKLIVFSEENMHLYYGSNVIAGNSDSYTCVCLDNQIGCYDQRTIKVHNSYLYWLYGRNIYEYDGATIRNIVKPTSTNGVTGGVGELLYGITSEEAKNVSVAGSEDKVYFWFPSFRLHTSFVPGIDVVVGSSTERQEVSKKVCPFLLIFDQRLRKWTKELQYDCPDELDYTNICDSYVDANFSKTPTPIYALTQNGVIYELTGGRREGDEYIQSYGKDEYLGSDGVIAKVEIPFYLKTKEFKNGVLSKKKSLSSIWFHYDLDGEVHLRMMIDDGKVMTKYDVLPKGKNRTECVLIPNEMQNVNGYTFEIFGKGDFCVYAMERKDRTHLR